MTTHGAASAAGRVRLIGLLLGIGAFLAFLLLPAPAGLPEQGRPMTAIAALMTVWWLTEAVPIPVTSLLPLVLFPLTGIMPMQDAASPYANQMVYLFLGGFLLALAIERVHLHRRIALHVIRILGAGPERLVFGFMCATAVLSMWISNTASTLMMLPIALAVAAQVTEGDEKGSPAAKGFAMALLLGAAYASSIGGVATLIGSAPNVLMAGFVRKLYPGAPEVGFLQWMLFGLPVAMIMLPIAWVMLVRVIPPVRVSSLRIRADLPGEVISRQLEEMGPMSRHERRVLTVFLLTAASWVFRAPIEIGAVRLPGLTDLVPGVTDSTIAMAAGVAVFLLPSRLRRGELLLTWDDIQRGVPWGVLLLFGGGFALAEGLARTGLTLFLGELIAGMTMLPPFVMLVVVCALLTFLTELTSNTATASILLPVMGGAAIALGINPLLLMIPATISASFAFMLPVGTPPNAIVFSSGFITIRQMARAGLLLNLAGIVVVSVLMYTLGALVFDIDPGSLPSWIGSRP